MREFPRSTRLAAGIVFAAGIVVFGASPSSGAEACGPQLTIQQIRLSELRDLRRRWTATLGVDASRCNASSGRFAISFVLEKDNTPEPEFIELFTWRTGPTQTGQIEVAITLWHDQTVLGYTLERGARCRCRE